MPTKAKPAANKKTAKKNLVAKAGPAEMTPEAYLASLAEPRRSEVRAVHEFVRRTVPKLKPYATAGGIGYGLFHYKYASGREGDAPKVGLSSRAAYISLYTCAADERGHVAGRYKERLPKASVGKCCVRFKRLADLNADALAELLREAERTGYGV